MRSKFGPRMAVFFFQGTAITIMKIRNDASVIVEFHVLDGAISVMRGLPQEAGCKAGGLIPIHGRLSS